MIGRGVARMPFRENVLMGHKNMGWANDDQKSIMREQSRQAELLTSAGVSEETIRYAIQSDSMTTAAKVATDMKVKQGRISWLIEMLGPSYLSARHLGGYEFFWTRDVHEGISFIGKEQADLVMMAVRQLRPDLFPACLPEPIESRQHVFIAGEPVRRL